MNRFVSVIMASAVALSTMSALAIEPGDTLYIPQRSIVVSGDTTTHGTRTLVGIIYDTEDLHFNDPQAPRFLFLDNKGKVAMGIGGYIKGTLQYDMNGAIDDGSNFTTYDIPVPLNPALRNQFFANASESTIFLKLVGKTTRFGYFTAYMQTNFTGNGVGGYGLKLKQAYLSLGAVTAGLTRSTFVDGASGVPTIDDEGPSGQTDAKNVLLQYRPHIGKHFTLAISAEMPSAKYTVDPQAESIKQRCPDIPVYAQYSWGRESHVRLSAILRNLSYRDITAAKNHFVTGWGVQLSGVARIAGGLKAYYQATYGKGIARYLEDLSDAGVDLIYAADGSGKMIAPHTLGFVGGLQYNFTPSFFVSAAYSQCRLYDQSHLGPDAFRYSQYIVANAFYNIVDDLRVGLEYLHGNRSNIDHQSGHANRLMGMLQFSF